MCGIAGIYNFKTLTPVTQSLLKAMTDTLVHRGPDDEGFYVSGPVGLGHRRLSIIDLEGGHQPIANEDETVWVVFNGEIYNFGELHEDLVKKGHTFKTRSDTEVIVHLYEEEGGEVLRKTPRDVCDRHLGRTQPETCASQGSRRQKAALFYFYDGSRIAFASEMKAIYDVPMFPVTLIRKLSRIISRFCIFQHPSRYLNIFVRFSEVIMSSHRTTEFVRSSIGTLVLLIQCNLRRKNGARKLLDTLREAVRLRLISDVPLGAFLSGGVDSSSVVAFMASLINDPVTTCSIGFEEKEFNELDYAREVASLFNTNHHERMVHPDAVGS